MSWSQPKFEVYGPSLENKNFNNFKLFNAEDVEVVGLQMLQNIEGSRNLSIRKEKKITTKKEDDLVKKRDLKK